jgi:hypothetical protein
MRSPLPISNITDFTQRLCTESLQASPAATKTKGYADAIEWVRGSLGSIKRKV